MAKQFHFEVQKKPTSQGKFPVYIRITQDRKHKRIKTSIALNSFEDWNSKQEKIRKSEPNGVLWNDALEKEMQAVKNSSFEDKTMSLDTLASVVKKKEVSGSFLAFAREKVEEARASQSIGTYRHYKTTMQQLEGFLKGRKKGNQDKEKIDLQFNEVTLDFLKKFQAYLEKVANQREAGRTLDKVTIANYLKKFRKIVNEAVAEGHILPNNNPFEKFKIEQGKESKKEKLEQAELDRLIALDLKKGSAEWHTRNAFLFSFYTAGIRVGDLLQLRWDNVAEGRLEYRMDKNGKERNYILVPNAEAILKEYRKKGNKGSDYIFPFLCSTADYAIESYKGANTMAEDLQRKLFNQIASKTVLLNRNLKLLALKARIKKNLSMHISRHTFANLAMHNNVSPSIIKMLMAHSDLKTTQNYMGNFSNDEADKALQGMFVRNDNKSQKEAILEALRDIDKEILKDVLKELIQTK